MLTEKADYIKSFYVRLLGLKESVLKPKLVFLHGLLGNGQNWVPVARKFEQNFEVLLLDQRGHGRTKEVDGGFAPKDFADDLLLVLDHLNWEKISLVGHSLGARTAFDFAARYSDRLDKLVLEDMGPHKTGPASRTTEEIIQSVPVPFADRAAAKAFFADFFEGKYGKVLSDYLYSNLEKKFNGAFDWRFNKKGALEAIEIGRERDFWGSYEAISTPHLIIRGEKSEHLPVDVYQEMLKRNSNAEGVEISGAGHWVHFDQFGDFVKQVSEFLL